MEEESQTRSEEIFVSLFLEQRESGNVLHPHDRIDEFRSSDGAYRREVNPSSAQRQEGRKVDSDFAGKGFAFLGRGASRFHISMVNSSRVDDFEFEEEGI